LPSAGKLAPAKVYDQLTSSAAIVVLSMNSVALPNEAPFQ
jgi:hypothetical protein